MITETRAESLQYERPSYLVAASYAPNYGILSDNGRISLRLTTINMKQACTIFPPTHTVTTI